VSISKAVWVVCDACDEDSATDYGERSVADARARARSDGWHQTKGRDICPDCWEAGER
jgi:hypothetical protein